MMLISLGGLPATGKTTIARALTAALFPAVHVRIDTIEQAVVDAGSASHPVGPVGYHVARALAADHLRQGLTVVADCVNPIAVTRDLWRDLTDRCLEVEIICSDRDLHQERVRSRTGDIPGMPLPSWEQIQRIDAEPWNRDHLVVDTAQASVDQAVATIVLAAQPFRTQRRS